MRRLTEGTSVLGAQEIFDPCVYNSHRIPEHLDAGRLVAFDVGRKGY
jgi:hypothetical protein